MAGISNIKADSPSNTRVKLYLLYMDGDVLAASASDAIQVSNVEYIDIGGSIYGHIIARNDASPPSDINMRIIVDGDLVEAKITNNHGGIDWLKVDGSATASGSSGTDVWASGTIKKIEVLGSYDGRIGENGEGLSGHPDIDKISIGGDFVGTGAMSINSLDELIVDGDFDADMTINTAMVGSTDLYDIGGSLVSAATLGLPADGLVGQIIVNSVDTSDAWNGNVVVGATTLAPNYTELSSELGGGHVGEAPFNFHQRTTAPPAGESRDCDPYQGEAVELDYDLLSGSNDEKNSVTIAHYGSVYANGATGPHFRVEFRPDIAPFPSVPAWEDRTSLFEIDTTQSGENNLTGQPTLVIKKTGSNKEGFRAAGRWRIRPIAGKVKCSDVSGNPDVEYQSGVISGDLGSSTGTQYSWYAFRTMLQAPSGAMLLNTGNGPQPSDVSSWLTSPYEVNADGETNAQDLIDMVDEMNSN